MRGAVFPKIGVMLLVAILLLRMVALLFTLTCRKVLFVVTSEVIEGLFVDFDGSIGHLFEVFYDHLIIRVFLIVFVALGTHIASQIVDGGSYGMGVLLVAQRLDKTLDISAIVLVADTVLVIAELAGFDGQILAGGAGVG